MAPRRTRIQAATRFFPRRVAQLWSLRKSSATSSINDAKMSRPAEMAFIVPTSTRPKTESGLYSVCVPIPIAWPIGVLSR